MLHTSPAAALSSAPDWSPVTHRLGLAELFARLAEGAAERDRLHRLPLAEVAELKARGFGALRLPAARGGAGVTLPELFAVARDLATADANIAHIFRNHFFAVEVHLRTPEVAYSADVLRRVAAGETFGVAVSEEGSGPAGARTQPGLRLEWRPEEGAYRISGRKIYSTGNLYADALFAAAIDGRTGEPTQFFIETDAPGVGLDDDWGGFGQKLTGSGTTVFTDVRVAPEDLHPIPPRPADAPVPWEFTFHQVYLTTAIAGVVNRIFVDALAHVRGRRRNFYHGLTERPADEPELQAAIGRLAAGRAVATLLVERAAAALADSWAERTGPEATLRATRATIAAAEAKVALDPLAAELAGLLIDVASGSGVSVENGFDRHWRNIKVIASHNPRLYKERVLGDHYLNGALPPTGAFF